MSAAPAPAIRHRMDPPIDRAWLDLWREEILEPDLPIVDPHHHLWDVPDWDSRYLLDDLLADLNSGHNIVATVFLQCWSIHRASGPAAMAPVWETEFHNGIAAMSASGNYGQAHIRAAGGRFRGIRHAVARDDSVPASSAAAPHLLEDPAYRAGFAQLAPLGLSYDAWLYHPQLPELTAIARAYPDTQIVVNHIGAPLGVGPYAGRRDEVFATWSASLRDLASCRNVYVKLGGLGMGRYGNGFHEQPAPPSSEALAAAFRPYIETCIEAFGTARCMFESNFPVDKGSYPYAAYWNACKVLTRGAGEPEKADLFRETAARFYRLSL
jgi:predicted TIM-barrel fold metal-dependent hydrolase